MVHNLTHYFTPSHNESHSGPTTLPYYKHFGDGRKSSTFEMADEIKMTTEAASSDDYGIFSNSNMEISQLEDLCLRDCAVIIAQPESFAKDLLERATRIQEEETTQAIECSGMIPGSERWISLYHSERIAKITTAKLCDLLDIVRTISEDEKVDNPEEKLILNAIRSWRTVYLEGDTATIGGSIKLATLLESNVGDKRPSTAQLWEGTEWDPRGEVPSEVEGELTNRLGKLLTELRPLEIAYRHRLLADGRVRTRNMAVAAVLDKKPVFAMQTEAINIFGLPMQMEGIFLVSLAQSVSQLLNVEVDLDKLIEEVDLDSWGKCITPGPWGSWGCATLQLKGSKIFAFGTPRQDPNVAPMVCIVQEAARLPDKKECRGYDHRDKPVQLSVGVQAVNSRRLGGHLDTVILFVVRGLRFANGAVEDGYALVYADVERRLKPTIDLFGGATLLIECRVHRVHKRPSKSNTSDRSWGTATEAFIEVSSTVCEDFDRLELQEECRRVIGIDHKQCVEVNLSGYNFLYVLNTECSAFDNNLPPACTQNWHGPLSSITMVRNDLTDFDILGALWERGVNISALERMVVSRGLASDSNGVWLDVYNERRQLQTERTATAQLVWKKHSSGPLQMPPEITKDDLKDICYCDAYRVARGTHSMALEEIGMQEISEMQRVMVLSLRARGMTFNYERVKPKISAAPGGKTTLGRYQVNAFVPQGAKDTPDSNRKLSGGGSGERTPRTPTTPTPMADRLNISQPTPPHSILVKSADREKPA